MANRKEVVAQNNIRSGRIEHTIPTIIAGSGIRASSGIVCAKKRQREDDEELVGEGRKRQRRLEDLRTRTLRASAGACSKETRFRTPQRTASRRAGGFCDALPAFEYQESEIQIVEAIGSTPRYMIFRIIAGSRPYHLYVYKYDFESILPNGLPGRNKPFERAQVAHRRVNLLHANISDIPVPRCRGYVNLSRLPQESRSSRCLRTNYTDFLDRGLSNIHDISREKAWRRYFENKSTSVKYILQALVLDEIVWEPFADSKFWSRDLEAWLTPPSGPAPTVIAQLIVKGLEFIHSMGIAYGSAQSLDTIWLQEIGELRELRILLADFSLAMVGEPGSEKLRWKQAKELKWWKQQAAILDAG